MIAGIWSPPEHATALYFPWSHGKCLSTVPRGTTGSKKQAPDISEAQSYPARGVHPPVPPSTHLTSLKVDSMSCDLGAVLDFDNYASSSSRICGLS
jgi:hypothetical protein